MDSRILIFVSLLPVTGLAQAINDPWTLAPALPTACYDSQDDLTETVASSIATLDEAIANQDATNDEVGGQVSDMMEADPYAMAAKMQQYAMNNPEKMAEMMQNLQSMGQTMSQDMSGDIETERELVGAMDDLMTRYKEAFADMRKPFEAAIAALPVRASEGGDVYTKEALEKLPAINQQGNADYEAFCRSWWQPTGPFASKLGEYKAFLTDERVPREDDAFEQGKNQWMIQGIDVSSTHSTAEMEAVRDYLKQMQRIYALRVDTPTDLHENAW